MSSTKSPGGPSIFCLKIRPLPFIVSYHRPPSSCAGSSLLNSPPGQGYGHDKMIGSLDAVRITGYEGKTSW